MSARDVIADAFVGIGGDAWTRWEKADHILSALSAAGLEICQGWRTMETAPRNKQPFLASNGHWRGVAMHWPPAYEDDPIWVDERTEFIEPPPTHWRPLPAAPQEDTR
jgi:hypothetical protein